MSEISMASAPLQRLEDLRAGRVLVVGDVMVDT